MLIKKLSLENFRKYKRQEFDLSPQTNLIVGPNTSGKTNILEAIFLLSFGSSHRAGLDREMIRQGAKFAFVLGKVEGSATKEIEVQLIANKKSSTLTSKRFKINGVGRRFSDFLPELHVVLFSPEDLNLIIGSPDLRRRFLDFALSNVDASYRRAVTEYEKVRKRRNRLLERISTGRAQEGELGFWDAKLLEFGSLLQDRRRGFFSEINTLLQRSGFSLQYLVSGLTAERLGEYRQREIAAETTLIGPHRDDFNFALGERDLAAFGSRSEQRRAILALKKAELDFVEKKIRDCPTLLLDDIFSELDEENRARVFDLLNEGQVIITTADINHIPKKLQKDLQVIQLGG